MSTADVEAVLVSALAPILGVPVLTQVPTDRPARFVRVVAAGGPPVDDLVLDRADVAWEAWGETSVGASELARRLRDALPRLAGSLHGGAWIADATCTRPRWFPDDSGQPRYVGQASLLVHATGDN